MNHDKHFTNIAVFASGAGSNAQKIIDHFKGHAKVKVALIVSNRIKADVLKIAERECVPTLVLEKNKFETTGYVTELHDNDITFIVLAGFLWKVPPVLIREYPERIINIHPALLPAYGGKGMYGNNVHEAVIKANEKESGLTIHYVDEVYDNGKIICQVRCTVTEHDTSETLAKKIHTLEHACYSKEIEKLLEVKGFLTDQTEGNTKTR